MSAEIFDPGMQPERTALAWRRTALSVAAGAVVAFRVFPGELGGWSVLLAGVALALAIVLFIASHRRYRRNHATLLSGRDGGRPTVLAGGGLIAVTAAMGVSLGALAAIVLVLVEARH